MFISLQKYLGIGKVYKNRNGVIYVVKSIEELVSVIIPLFDYVSLNSSKFHHYELFKNAVLLTKDKNHL